MPVCQRLQTNKQGFPSPSSQRAPAEPTLHGNSWGTGIKAASYPRGSGAAPVPRMQGVGKTLVSCGHRMSVCKDLEGPCGLPRPAPHGTDENRKCLTGCCRQNGGGGSCMGRPQRQRQLDKSHIPWPCPKRTTWTFLEAGHGNMY